MTSNIYINITEEPVIEFYNGDILKDRYQILNQNASQKANGKIYYCMDLWNKKPCVLKAHPVQLAKNAKKSDAEIYRQELYRLTQLPPHPYVMPLFRIEIIQNIYFLVTEWYPHSLTQYLLLLKQQGDSLSVQEVLTAALSVCEGMLHCIKWLSTPEHAFVHGDLKPDNILVSQNGTLKISDFGGGYTKGYASTEQLEHRSFDTRSDIYSLGVIIDELCGFCQEKPPALEQLLDITAHCRQKLPENRIQSFDSLKQQLIRLYHDMTGSLPTPPKYHADPAQFEITQLCSLAMIGEPVNIYGSLTNLMKSNADDSLLADGFYHAAEIMCTRGFYETALSLYDNACACDHDKHSAIWTGKAYAYWCMRDWQSAHNCAAHALQIDMFDYFAIKISIDCVYMLGINNTMALIYTALQALYEKRPDSTEPLKYMGYIHYLQKEFGAACRLFEAYINQRKNDWEIFYFYGTALYMENDTTKAWEHLQTAIQMMETDEEDGLNRTKLQYLAISNYYLNETVASITYLERYEEHYEMTPEIIATEAMHYYDMQITEQYGPKLSEIAEKITEGETDVFLSPQFYRNVIPQLEQLKEDWMQEPNQASVSSTIRRLNRQACFLEIIAYIHLEEYDKAASACDETLKWDHSMPEALFNKAECLIQMNQVFDAVCCYQEALKYQKNPKRNYDIRLRLNEAIQCFRSSPSAQCEFIQKLFLEAEGWKGSPVQLQQLINGKEDLFDGQFCNTFQQYVESCIERIKVENSFFQLFTVMPDTGLPSFVRQCSLCISVMQQVEGPLKGIFIETAIQVYNILIRYAKTDAPVFFNLLPVWYSFRGTAYLHRIHGDKASNMDQCIFDLQCYMAEAKQRDIYDKPVFADIYNNIGSAYLEKAQDNREENLEAARTNYQKALSLVSKQADFHLWAMIQYNIGRCEFKMNHYSASMAAFQNSLEYITIKTMPKMFADANEYTAIIGTIILPVTGESRFENVFKETLNAYQNTLKYYTQHDFPEKHASILLEIAVMMKKRYERLQDNSLVFLRHYHQMIHPADLCTDSEVEMYENLKRELENMPPIHF